jgi:ceramide glucosyltransferase
MNHITTIMACGATLYAAILISKFTLAIYYRWSFSRRPKTATKLDRLTIMQPILSGDPALKEMLQRNVNEHPEASFLWLLDEQDSEGQRVVQEVVDAHDSPNIKVVLCPPCPEGINPKLFKFYQARKQIERDFVIVLDDDTFLPMETCRALIDGLQHYGLVTGLPCYMPGSSLPSRLLAQFVNSNAAMTYLPLAPIMEPITINGMCYALKRDTLIRLDYFGPLLGHLTDDLAVARSLLIMGENILQIPRHQLIQTNLSSISAYMRQMHRWFFFALLLLRSERPTMKALILLLQGIHPFLLLCLIVSTALMPTMIHLSILGIVIALRSAAILVLQIITTGSSRHSPLLSLLSEILQPIHLMHAAISNRIRWRTRHYRVLNNDRFYDVEPL